MRKTNFCPACVLAVALVTVHAHQPAESAEKNNTGTPLLQITDNDSRSVYRAPASQADVVVIATRLQTPAKEIGSSYTVIDAEQIKNEKKSTVTELMRNVPSVAIVESGGPGRTVSAFIRGADSDHTLVMVDGIEVNDPVSPSRGVDLAHFQTTNVDRIEVIRGPQSTLYGSDAMGGVINIVTKKGEGKPTVFASTEMGSFETIRSTGGFSGGTNLYNYSFEVSQMYTKGFSAATHTKGNREEDSYENLTVAGRIGLTPLDNLELSTSLRFIEAETETDDDAGRGGDDPNRFSNLDQFFLRSEAKLSLFDDIYEQIFGVSFADFDRDERDNPDPLDPLWTRAHYDSQFYQVDYQHNIYVPEFNVCGTPVDNVLTVGIEYEKERAKSRNQYAYRNWMGFITPALIVTDPRSAHTWSTFIQEKLSIGNMFFTTFGVRWDNHSQSGTHTTFRIVPALWIEQTGTKFKFSVGTGFKEPSLYQMYSSMGNQRLKPEESESWEVGIEQYLFEDKLHCGITYYETNFKNLIDAELIDPFAYTYQYLNVDEAEANGLELFADLDVTENLRLGFTYNYLMANEKLDDGSHQARIRRPKNTLGITANYKFLEKGNLNCELLYVGGRPDEDFSTWPATPVRLEGYTLVNIAASYKVHNNVELFGRIHNLLDDYHEEVFGYDTQGFSMFGGVKIEL